MIKVMWIEGFNYGAPTFSQLVRSYIFVRLLKTYHFLLTEFKALFPVKSTDFLLPVHVKS